MKALIKIDVPVVLSAGNGKTEGQLNVNDFPQFLEGPDLPLIIVGANDYDGKVSAFSQGGPHLTVLAPGEDIQAEDPVLPQKAGLQGTSFCKSKISDKDRKALQTPPDT